MLRRCIRRDERQIDLGLRSGGGSIFAFSADSFNRCNASLSLPQIDALLFLELVGR